MNPNFIEYLYKQVNTGAIYVRGAQGENLSEMGYEEAVKWIRRRETVLRPNYAAHKDEYDRNADRAVAMFNKRLEDGFTDIRAFDCSGLIMHFLQNLTGICSKDMTAAGIYANLCTTKYSNPLEAELLPGDIVFRSGSSGITHCGVYVGDNSVIEAKGRDYGVVKTVFSTGKWDLAGHIPQLDDYLVNDPIIYIMESGHYSEAVAALQEALKAGNYTDGDGRVLKVDGKYGPKTAFALRTMISINREPIGVTIYADGEKITEATL